MSARFFTPFNILQRFGASYKLEVPLGTQIQPVFHVTLLKKRIEDSGVLQEHLPLNLTCLEGNDPQPQAVLDHWVKNEKQEVLIHWKGKSFVDATWVDSDLVKN